MTPPLLTAPRRAGRSLRTQLLLWQAATLLVVIAALSVGTLVFTERYVRTQLLEVRRAQALSVLHDTDLPLALQGGADEAAQDDWMTHWRAQSGAALLAGWGSSGQVAFDAENVEVAQAFIRDDGHPRSPDGQGVRVIDGRSYYWLAETLFHGQREAGRAVIAFALPGRADVLLAVARHATGFVLLALALALAGTLALWRQIRRTLMNQEPADLAALSTQQAQIIGTVTDGMLALDRTGQITVANAPAAQALGLARLPASSAATWPELAQLPVDTARRVPLPLAGRVVLVNVTPLGDGGRIVAFTDRAQATRLAEELTDTRQFVDAVRARAHEYGNRLHIIAGFLQLGRTGEALSVIQDELEAEAALGQALGGITEPRVAALLAGKVARAHELKLTLSVAPTSEVPPLTPDQGDALVTALGNYIENAFELLAPGGQVQVDLGLDPDGLSAEVRDDGPGVPGDFNPFLPGATSKGEGRGYGLAGVAALARAVGGEVWFERQGRWTVFGLNLPLAATQAPPLDSEIIPS